MSADLPVALALAGWAHDLAPTADDRALADRSLLDTVSVGLAARDHPILGTASSLSEVARWAIACHVLDFDDLHMPSTTHISTVCVPVALATGGGAHAYLAGAGVMARLGSALGWAHYAAGWHATTTSGALAAAVTAAVARGAGLKQLATAMALAVPAAGGVQRAFGTDAKSLQVGFAVDAGVRAADLAMAGAGADVDAVDAWLDLLGGDPDALDLTGPAVPGGLAIKLHPCCYALQRPISAILGFHRDVLEPESLRRIAIRTPRVTVTPLIHHRPRTGLQGKFSLEYAAAAALLDDWPGFASFTDEAVQRPEAQRLVDLVDVELIDGGDHLLSGTLDVELHTARDVLTGTLALPPGAPSRPPTPEQLRRKASDCLAGTDVDAGALGWDDAAQVLRDHLPHHP
jgi:2-methylcitrate dehydratase PrpD